MCRFYESMYDNAEYLNMSYPPNLTPEEQLEYVTETAKVLLVTRECSLYDATISFESQLHTDVVGNHPIKTASLSGSDGGGHHGGPGSVHAGRRRRTSAEQH